jgi:transcriptional regulator of acetoin/glycerol metabolism
VYSALNLNAWPGNIRELENVIERALVLDRDGVLTLEDLPDRFRGPERRLGNVRIELPDEGISLEEVERQLLLAALEKHNWNQTRAAGYLGVTRSTLLYRMQKFERSCITCFASQFDAEACCISDTTDPAAA